MKIEKKMMDAKRVSTTAVRLMLSPSREGDATEKGWQIIFFVPAFYEKERKNCKKKCRVGVKGHGVSVLFQWKILFKAEFSQQRRPGPMVMRTV